MTFTTTTPAVCTAGGVDGSSITLVATGTCTVRAAQAGDAYWRPATAVNRSFTVTLPPPAIQTFTASITTLGSGGGAVELSAAVTDAATCRFTASPAVTDSPGHGDVQRRHGGHDREPAGQHRCQRPHLHVQHVGAPHRRSDGNGGSRRRHRRRPVTSLATPDSGPAPRSVLRDRPREQFGRSTLTAQLRRALAVPDNLAGQRVPHTGLTHSLARHSLTRGQPA